MNGSGFSENLSNSPISALETPNMESFLMIKTPTLNSLNLSKFQFYFEISLKFKCQREHQHIFSQYFFS
ncbi:unnamed protein product [Caenorhabditis angaria]|uniref:Uncharacterized protein n=1 Tax=Caenorhabditis angaria TaxID=860376 RepID=A0A9P1MVG2_9PELO|nr:unnamed protein product [Caenorhabditis angaria]